MSIPAKNKAERAGRRNRRSFRRKSQAAEEKRPRQAPGGGSRAGRGRRGSVGPRMAGRRPRRDHTHRYEAYDGTVHNGEMLDILIEENTDLEVEITQGVGGGTSNIQPAMESGEFDIYPEYTGTAWNIILKREELYTEDMFGQLQDEYWREYDMEWMGMYGFNNSYALAVRGDVARQYGLEKISDLQSVAPRLTFGAEYDFYEREDGYEPLCETYGLTFAGTVDLDIGLKYQAINSSEIDVMPIFTTDGQFSVSDVVVLEDDRQFYPSYRCGNIVRGQVLRDHPELEKILGMVEGILSDEEMAALNYSVETEGREPRDVAEGFLREKGLISREEM